MSARIRYVDSAGWRWDVCEILPDITPVIRADAVSPGEDAAGTLYFFSRMETRRLERGYPSAWNELPRSALEQLCRAARTIE